MDSCYGNGVAGGTTGTAGCTLAQTGDTPGLNIFGVVLLSVSAIFFVIMLIQLARRGHNWFSKS